MRHNFCLRSLGLSAMCFQTFYLPDYNYGLDKAEADVLARLVVD